MIQVAMHYSTTTQLYTIDMQQASCKAEPGDYKHAVNDM